MTGPNPPTPEGLCDSCVHAERTGNTRGSAFVLCGLSLTDPAFRKYPRLPVLKCPGYRAPAGEPSTEPRTGRG